jgi:HAE1 family hydrophobic/amphiphilic exporter-1
MAIIAGEGSELRRPQAITVIFGLVFATFLTIIVIPAIYLGSIDLFNKLFKRKT